MWSGWSRDCSIFCFVNADILKGLENIGYAKNFELKPYTLCGIEKLRYESTNTTGKIGADLNVNLSPTLKLNLTANTDFAQVKADRIAVNLSRFNLFYPENFRLVSVIAGARLFGEVGANNIGLLNIQTASKDDVPATNNTVLRYKHDIGSQFPGQACMG
ncbi:hypothetical protein BH10BAC2_BH10BAC2_30240 [soil metagenome]